MHTQSGSKENKAAGVMPRAPSRPAWRVENVEALPDYKLRVAFHDGLEGIVDMKELVHSEQAGVFAVLADPELFAKAYIDRGAVTWPGEIDLAPDAMHSEIKNNGIWNPA